VRRKEAEKAAGLSGKNMRAAVEHLGPQLEVREETWGNSSRSGVRHFYRLATNG
jgi:hypothetical protein